MDVSLPSERVVTVLERLVAINGLPRWIRCDNGPEIVAEVLRTCCEARDIQLVFI